MQFTSTLKSLLTAKSATLLFRLLLKSNGSFEVVADSDLPWVFIYTEQVFTGTGKQLNADLYGYSYIKTQDLPTLIFHVLVFQVSTDVDAIEIKVRVKFS